MKQNANKMLYEKAAAMARAMDEKYKQYEACRKVTEYACEKALEHETAARQTLQQVKAAARRAAASHGAAITIGVIANAVAGAAAAYFMIH